jgi:bifunctional DNA-binding transcriptional regulator/antitoxin component of YhaV-PrlF toxin-antitoxin module
VIEIPTISTQWYGWFMSAVYVAKVGNKGRVVIPAGLRESRGWTDETVLVFVDELDTVRLVSRDDLERQVLAEMAGGPSLADELIAERRAEARRDASE